MGSATGNPKDILSSIRKSQGSCCFITSEGKSISCKTGDIVSEQAHTVVCPQGECSKAISYSSGLQFPKAEIGELIVWSGLDLSYSCVILTRCSNWNGGDGEQCLKDLVQRSLREVHLLAGASVAFPAIGTGKLQFPPREIARIMVDETIKFCRENPDTTITDVRFILLPQDTAAIDAFWKEINSHQKKPVRNEVPPRDEDSVYDSVRIFTGDLTRESQTDAILNIISTNMTMKTGSVSGAVFRAAGKDIEEEFNSKALRYDFPEAVMTSGGDLNVPHIIHIIPNSGNKQSIMQSLEKGLLLAKQNNIRSLSIPAIGTGWYGLSPSDSASLIFEALSNVWISSQRFPAKVHIVLFTPQFLSPFQQEKQKYISRNIQTEIWYEKVEIVQGDLTMENQTQAIFNVTANNMNVKKPGSLSAAVVRAAGWAVEKEFQTKTRQLKNPKAVMTSAGMLSVSHIIHIIPTSSDREAIKTSLEKGLLLAKQSNIRSISLPAVGTGWYGLSYLESANMIFQAMSNFWGSYACFSRVRIVLLQNDAIQAFQQVKCQQKSGLRNSDRYQVAMRAISLPEYWDQVPSHGQDVHTVSLNKYTTEYDKVSKQFYATAKGVTIRKIERIQNPWLYRSYILLKEKMEKNNGTSNERLLFHATSFHCVKSINSSGFKRNLNAAHGTLYGQGVYFGKDASVSLHYAKGSPGQRCMYLVRVLVGKSCQGTKDMKTPSLLNGISGKQYDSAVDLLVNPREFVIFHDTQSYPEYLITF